MYLNLQKHLQSGIFMLTQSGAHTIVLKKHTHAQTPVNSNKKKKSSSRGSDPRTVFFQCGKLKLINMFIPLFHRDTETILKTEQFTHMCTLPPRHFKHYRRTFSQLNNLLALKLKRVMIQKKKNTYYCNSMTKVWIYF